MRRHIIIIQEDDYDHLFLSWNGHDMGYSVFLSRVVLRTSFFGHFNRRETSALLALHCRDVLLTRKYASIVFPTFFFIEETYEPPFHVREDVVTSKRMKDRRTTCISETQKAFKVFSIFQ